MHYILIGFLLFVGAALAYCALVFGFYLCVGIYLWVQDNREAFMRALVVTILLVGTSIYLFVGALIHPQTVTTHPAQAAYVRPQMPEPTPMTSIARSPCDMRRAGRSSDQSGIAISGKPCFAAGNPLPFTR